eukprot:433847_1
MRRIFDRLNDILGIEYEYIQDTQQASPPKSNESKPKSTESITLSDAYFGFETGQNTTTTNSSNNFVYNVSNDEVLVRLSGFKLYGGARLTITDDKSQMKITHVNLKRFVSKATYNDDLFADFNHHLEK